MAAAASALTSVEGYLPGTGAEKSFTGVVWDLIVPAAVVVALIGTGMPKGILHWFVAGVLLLVALGFLVNLFTTQL